MTQQTKCSKIRNAASNSPRFAYLFCFTGVETEIHNIKDDSKIIRQTNLDRHGLRPIPIICHLLDPPSFSLPTTFQRTMQVAAVLDICSVNIRRSFAVVFPKVFRGKYNLEQLFSGPFPLPLGLRNLEL
jgi:hypothetical protein